MSNPQYDYPLQLAREQRIKEYIREAEIDRLQSELHSREWSCWAQRAHHPLHVLGHALTSLGRRLENLDRPDARPMRESDAISAALQNR